MRRLFIDGPLDKHSQDLNPNSDPPPREWSAPLDGGGGSGFGRAIYLFAGTTAAHTHLYVHSVTKWPEPDRSDW